MKLIVAVNNNNQIGKDGKMLWYSPDDFKHFKEKTSGGILICGKRTFEEDLKGKVLPNREMLIVGSGYLSLGAAVKTAYLSGKEIWVIGGAMIYRQLINLCDEVHMSVINNDDTGDTIFKIPDDYRGKVYKYYFEEKIKLQERKD